MLVERELHGLTTQRRCSAAGDAGEVVVECNEAAAIDGFGVRVRVEQVGVYFQVQLTEQWFEVWWVVCGGRGCGVVADVR